MSGIPPGQGPVRAMSVGNGPPSAGLPQHNAMPPQGGPPPPSSTGPQSQQNLNQIVGEVALSFRLYDRHRLDDSAGKSGAVEGSQ